MSSFSNLFLVLVMSYWLQVPCQICLTNESFGCVLVACQVEGMLITDVQSMIKRQSLWHHCIHICLRVSLNSDRAVSPLDLICNNLFETRFATVRLRQYREKRIEHIPGVNTLRQRARFDFKEGSYHWRKIRYGLTNTFLILAVSCTVKVRKYHF